MLLETLETSQGLNLNMKFQSSSSTGRKNKTTLSFSRLLTATVLLSNVCLSSALSVL